LSVTKRVVEKAVGIVLDLFVFVTFILGLILSVDFVGLSIYFSLRGVSWNFYVLSWISLVEGLVLMMLGVLALGGREYVVGAVGFLCWLIRICKLTRRPYLYEIKFALTLFVTGIILFFLGLILFGT